LETNQKKTAPLDKKAALAKAEHYCAYQERSQYEIRNKLYEWGLYSTDVENIITELILTNFLNEERFAKAYVSGKFNINKWGKIKIKQGLKLKKVPDKMITRALNGIDLDDYLSVLQECAEKKLRTITEKEPFKRKYKLITYLLTRGFENNLILDVLKNNHLLDT
jgi:regulatory protein